jgi:uncharacterized protein YdeI (YjbR/CyaY-like superfamily)
MKPVFFKKQSDLRKWFEKNADTATSLLIGYYRVATEKPSVTWPQSVDEALCFGWIDSIRNSIDAESYSIRFTPRKTNSIWSAVNIKKVEELKKKVLMKPKGLELFNMMDKNKLKTYSFERSIVELPPEFEKKFKANKKAWKYFQQMSPSYRKPVINWVITAKQAETKLRRLAILIKDSKEGRKIKGMDYPKKNKKPPAGGFS